MRAVNPVFFLLLCLSCLVTGEAFAATLDDLAIERLKEVQRQVSAVVERNMEACVAVTDGTGSGSGVIVSADGLVLTAGHVLESSGTYELIFPSGKTVRAKPLGKNLTLDAGMLQILDPGPYPFVEINRERNLRPGQWVVAIGHSGGFELGRTPPVRSGRILGVAREQMFTDAVLIGGDSGGPLFDLSGMLIGIHSSIGDTVAENRHVTMDAFLNSWDRMKQGESWGQLPELEDEIPQAQRGSLGVRVDLAANICRIRLVNPGSPAEQAGIQAGDVVLRFEGVRIIDGQHLIDVVKQRRAGDTCVLLIERNGRRFEREVELR